MCTSESGRLFFTECCTKTVSKAFPFVHPFNGNQSLCIFIANLMLPRYLLYFDTLSLPIIFFKQVIIVIGLEYCVFCKVALQRADILYT